MPVQHRQISVDQAAAGMVLSDDLLDAQGNILIAKGVMLTDSILAALRRHQIDAVTIESGMLTDAEVSARRRHDGERLAKLFRKPANDAEDATGILQQYVRYYRLGADES